MIENFAVLTLCLLEVRSDVLLHSFHEPPFPVAVCPGVGRTELSFTYRSFGLVSRLIEMTMTPSYNIVRQAHTLVSSSAAGVVAMGATELAHNSFIDLPKELFQMLACAGPYLYRDTILLQKV